jgi:hypothetical protein
MEVRTEVRWTLDRGSDIGCWTTNGEVEMEDEEANKDGVESLVVTLSELSDFKTSSK